RCPPPGDRPFVDVTAKVESPTPPTRAQAEIETRDADGATRSRSVALTLTPDGPVWSAAARGVPAAPGGTAGRGWAWTAGGRRAARPGEARCLAGRPLPPPPGVELRGPGDATRSPRPDVVVTFRVRSRSPLAGVTLLRADSPSDSTTLGRIDPARAARDARG